MASSRVVRIAAGVVAAVAVGALLAALSGQMAPLPVVADALASAVAAAAGGAW